MKTWVVGIILIVLALINISIVADNKRLIKEDIKQAEDYKTFRWNIQHCRDTNSRLRADHDRLLEDYNNIKDEYHKLVVGK